MSSSVRAARIIRHKSSPALGNSLRAHTYSDCPGISKGTNKLFRLTFFFCEGHSGEEITAKKVKTKNPRRSLTVRTKDKLQ